MNKSIFVLLLFVGLVSSQTADQLPAATTESPSDDTTASPLLPLPDPEDEKFNEIGSGGGPHASSPNKTRLISDEDWTKLADKLKVNKKKLPLLKKIGEKIDTVIDRVNENNGRVAPELFVEEFLPDPLKIKDIPISKNDGLFTWYSGRFSNIEMYGVSTVKIESVKINVGKFTAKMLLNVPLVYLTGNYTLEGEVSFVGIEGQGAFRFNVSEIEIDAYGNLNRTDEDALQIGNIELDVSPGDMNIDLENFSVFGSEMIANAIISSMSNIIFSQVKYTVLEKTSAKIQALINQRLEKVPVHILKRTGDYLFDDIVAFAAEKIATKVEPLKLPPIQREFNAKWMLFHLNASIHIDEGKLFGLTTFARTGDISVTYEEEAVSVEAEVGFKNVTGSYNWALSIIGRGPSGSASLQIRKVSAFLRIRQELRRGSIPELQKFRVDEIDHVWVDLNGLGVWDYLLELIVNTVSNAFRMPIANMIVSKVSSIIQETLKQAQISFIP